MYSERWSPQLRQGDILGPIHLPLIGNKHEVLAVLPDIASETAGAPDKMLLPAARRYVAIASHDCEFNEDKRDRILLARIHGIPKHGPNLDDDLVAELRASNDIYARQEAGENVAGVDNFVVDPIDGHFDEPHVIVFTTITPFPAKKMLAQLHAAKRAELEHAQRLLFRRKLAWFFMRSHEDIPEDEKLPPEEVMSRLQEQQGG